MRKPKQKYPLLWREAIAFSIALTIAILMETVPESPKRAFQLYVDKGWMTTVGAWVFVWAGFLLFRRHFHLFMVVLWTVLGFMLGEKYGMQAAVSVAGIFLLVRYGIRAVMLRSYKQEMEAYRQVHGDEDDDDDEEEVDAVDLKAFLKRYDRKGYAIAFDREGLRRYHWMIESISPDTPVLISKDVLYSVDPEVTQYLEWLQGQKKHSRQVVLLHADQRLLLKERLDPQSEGDRTVGSYLQYQLTSGRQVILICEDSATRIVARSVGVQCETLAG